MGELVITCNNKQLNAIISDFGKNVLPADVASSRSGDNQYTVTISYTDDASEIVAGIVKYRMKDYENYEPK